MLLRKPSRTVTGAPAAAPDVDVDPDDEEDEDEQPASNKAVPIAAAVIARRI
jgi:hypothetical protein